MLRAALSALESDYRVQVPVDACGGLSARTEDAALRQIEAAGGVTTSVVSLMTAMAYSLPPDQSTATRVGNTSLLADERSVRLPSRTSATPMSQRRPRARDISSK